MSRQHIWETVGDSQEPQPVIFGFHHHSNPNFCNALFVRGVKPWASCLPAESHWVSSWVPLSWVAKSVVYNPSLASSSSWVPVSTILPSSMTTMRSAFFMLNKRWAIMTTVRPSMALLIASATRCSFSESKALVASSKMRMLGLRRRARAIATRCRCPPEILPPSLPTSVSYPF
mmetsp:Transcript_100125/g.172863  ORF Transcript_100125/g.172863 Transcript_100125/m.172863 type:complete len:174 (+) Transcript_100125:75-596(+)